MQAFSLPAARRAVQRAPLAPRSAAPAPGVELDYSQKLRPSLDYSSKLCAVIQQIGWITAETGTWLDYSEHVVGYTTTQQPNSWQWRLRSVLLVRASTPPGDPRQCLAGDAGNV